MSRGRDVVEILHALARLHPREAEVARPMVITAAPGLWSALSATPPELWTHVKDFQPVVLDVSKLLDMNATRNMLRSSLEADLIEQFVEAGWPKEALFSEYRPEVRSAFITDLAILDIDRNWQVAVEVKPSSFLVHRNIRPLMDRLLNNTEAEWVCVTDGNRFYFAHRGASEQLVLEEAPSPSALGFDAMAQHRLGDDSIYTTDTLRPLSVEELAVAMQRRQPDGITLDPTIPWNRFGDKLEETGYYRYGRAILNLTKETLSDEENERLRKALRIANRGRVGAQHVFLAWLCSLPSTKSLSTFANAHFLTSTGESRFKEYVSEHLPLCGVVELPSQMFRPLSSFPSNDFYLASSILYLGGERNRAYFDIVTSSGDFTRPWTQPWYESLSKWMADEKPTTGYTTRGKSSLQWSFAANDPDVDETVKRLRKLGSLIKLGELCELYRAGGPYSTRPLHASACCCLDVVSAKSKLGFQGFMVAYFLVGKPAPFRLSSNLLLYSSRVSVGSLL